MLGCPHASIDQFRDVARLLDGKKIKTHLWMFTSRAVKTVADMSGFTKKIEDAGGLVMTDTCSAIARAVPKGTKVVALDSAKQTHYLPAMVGVEAWFGTTEDCINAALTGRWTGELQMIVLHGRGIVGGCAEGEALVTRETISGWGGIDPMTGTVIETRHELRGQSFKDKVLVFPGAKGSSGWSNAFHMTRLTKSAPLAMVFNQMTTKIALGAVVTRVPAVTDLDQDPLSIIETGDWVKVDGDAGTVEITKKR